MSQFPGDIGSVYLRRRHDPFAQYDPRRDMTPGVNRNLSLVDRLRMGANQGRTHRGGREINRPAGRRIVPNIPGYQRSPGKGRGPSGPGKGGGPSRQPLDPLRNIGNVPPSMGNFNRALQGALRSGIQKARPSQNYRQNLFRQPPPPFDPRGSGAIASGEVQLPGHQGRIGQRPGMPGGREPISPLPLGPVASIPTPVPPPYMPGFPEPGRGRGPSGPGKGRGPIMGSPGFPSPGKGRGPSGPGKGRGPIGSPGFPSPGKGRGPSGPGKGRGPSMPGKGRQNMPQPGGYYPQPPSSPSYPDAGIPPFSAPPSYNAPIMSPGYGQMQNTANRFAGYGIPQNMTDTFQFPHYQPYTPPAPLMQTGPEPYQPEPQLPGDPYRPPGASFQTPDDPHRSSGSPANPPAAGVTIPTASGGMYQPMGPQQPPTFIQPNIGLPGRGGFGSNFFGGYSGLGF